MGITLRTEKGVALTYNEMDKNYSQFFYSASKVGGNLVLHYTGSTNLNSAGEDYTPGRTITINLDAGSTAESLIPGGIQGSVQYNAGGGLLGGESTFFYDSTLKRLGINIATPSGSIHILSKDSSTPGTLRLEGGTTSLGRRAYTEFYRSGIGYGTIGLSTDSTDIYQNTSTGTRFQIAGTDKMHITASGIGIYPNTANYAIPNHTLTVVGSIGVGTTVTGNGQSVIKQLESEANAGIPPSISGSLLIEGPRSKGNVIIGLTTDSVAAEAFAVIRRSVGSTYSAKVATIYSNGNTELSGSLLVRDIEVSTANLGSAVIATTAGVLKKIDAAPVPKGGIIMWSGAIVNIPTGWALCDGSNETPDLRDRFVVGAGSIYSVSNTGGSADTILVNHTHTVTIVDPGHNHDFPGVGPSGRAGTDIRASVQQTRTTDNATTGITATNSTEGESGTNKNLPPYLALAYIMYKGI